MIRFSSPAIGVSPDKAVDFIARVYPSLVPAISASRYFGVGGLPEPVTPRPRAAPRPAVARPAPSPAPRPSAAPRPMRSQARTDYRCERGTMIIRGDISGYMAAEIKRDLAACHRLPVKAFVRSSGGCLDSAVDIAQAISEHGQVTATLVEASSGALAFCAASRVIVFSDAQYLLHGPMIKGRLDGMSVADFRATADEVDKAFVAFSRCFEPRITDTMFRLLAADDRQLSGEEMVKYGLADNLAPQTLAEARARASVRARASTTEEDDVDLEAEIQVGVAAALAALRKQLFGTVKR